MVKIEKHEKKGKKVYVATASKKGVYAKGKTRRKALRNLYRKLCFVDFKNMIVKKIKKFLHIK